MYRKHLISFCVVLLLGYIGMGQEKGVNWLSFEQLEDSLAVKPKKVLIDFYADWCVYCKKMEKVAFRDPDVVSRLNNDYYVVKMDAETTDTISFGGGNYRNKQLGKKRRPTHEIALLLASRKGYPFSLPAVVILNEKFEITARYFEYLSPAKLMEVINE
ncbi:thioredoxin fold domain-containing protein [Leptobacterium flavescens]|uniref:Thioredoxin fold domain-containing protein n=1 Tax=Leptobacterium flavescens TaxID=472055 RepID=A0A6P0UPG6_9FLAO|nr:thioredoxin family protein [Leptobacterium flavescens]NER14887.1 thioredoxin fold domain-containing protein [Leptobacterium flavescens]